MGILKYKLKTRIILLNSCAVNFVLFCVMKVYNPLPPKKNVCVFCIRAFPSHENRTNLPVNGGGSAGENIIKKNCKILIPSISVHFYSYYSRRIFRDRIIYYLQNRLVSKSC